MVAIVATEDELTFVKCTCPCGMISAAVFRNAKLPDRISDEDVLIVHEFLKTYEGDALGLFK